jgi:hypothetical protein
MWRLLRAGRSCGEGLALVVVWGEWREGLGVGGGYP